MRSTRSSVDTLRESRQPVLAQAIPTVVTQRGVASHGALEPAMDVLSGILGQAERVSLVGYRLASATEGR